MVTSLSDIDADPVIDAGRVYAIGQGGRMVALELNTGQRLWELNIAGTGTPWVAGDFVFVITDTAQLLAIARTTITTQVHALSDIDADPVIDQGRVYAIGSGGRMVALELNTGQRLWELNIAGTGTPWVAGDFVFVITDTAQLLAIARTTGRIRWMSQLQRFRDMEDRRGTITWRGPVLAGGRLVLVNTLGQIIFASPTDGSVLQTVNTNTPISLAPVVAGNTLYILDDRGRLTAYR